ncbi:MAG: cyclodeaminase/cyclohydrolase family protein [Planctomycetota bacterium]
MTKPLHEMPLGKLLESTASKSPTPGGGAIAAVTGALGAALAGMSVAFSVGKKSLAEHEDELQQAADDLKQMQHDWLGLSQADASAYAEMNRLQRLDEGDPARAGLAAAIQAATNVPMQGCRMAETALHKFERLSGITNRWLLSDLAIAAVLAEAACRACAWNVRVNLPSIEDATRRAELDAEAAALVRTCRELTERVEDACKA